jgi:tetratricopeptide (TPR) repeat protein
MLYHQAFNPEILMRTSHSLVAALLFSTPSSHPTSPPLPAKRTRRRRHRPTRRPDEEEDQEEDQFGRGVPQGLSRRLSLIYDQGDYVGGIAALHALGYDDNADVATLLGYASRKLGRYDDSKFWYERALAADPNHAVTWSYYGMWQAEQGNVLKAKDDLEKVRLICGTDCKPYKMLKDVIDGTATY